MSGYRVIAIIGQLNRISELFAENLAELRSTLDSMRDSRVALPILDVTRPNLHDAFLAKCERHLHNVACAAVSRVDHHRRLFVNAIPAELVPMQEQYAARVQKKFVGCGLAQFVQGLRNHLVHRDFPRMLSVNSFSVNSWSVQACLDRDHLIGWDGWSASAGTWLAQQSENVDIIDALTQYAQMIIEFDQWICGCLVDIHRDDLQKYEIARQSYDVAFMRVCNF